jgi:hypothetical protein
MEIRPPAPDPPATQHLRHRFGSITMVLIGFCVLLLVTLAAWILLWGGGIREAVKEDSTTSPGQRP